MVCSLGPWSRLSPADVWSVCLMPDSTLLSWQRPRPMLVSDQLPCCSIAPTIQGRLRGPLSGEPALFQTLWVRPHPCSLLCGFTLCPYLQCQQRLEAEHHLHPHPYLLQAPHTGLDTCRHPTCQGELAYHLLGRNGPSCE